MSSSGAYKNSIHWFRKCLRLHDNPALVEAINQTSHCVYPVFVLDPHFAKPHIVGKNRYSFLLESLQDLDKQLRSLNKTGPKTRLFVVEGKPENVFKQLWKKWDISLMTFESEDVEPYGKIRDTKIIKQSNDANVDIQTYCSHTLHSPEYLTEICPAGKIPSTYGSFCKLMAKAEAVEAPLNRPSSIPAKGIIGVKETRYDVPELEDLGYEPLQRSLGEGKFIGGETVGLKRLRKYMGKTTYICNFQKPQTKPNSLEPSTTVLSPYLKFGCVSVRKFYHDLHKVYKGNAHTSPPTSLLGQLYWREFAYLNAYATGEKFGKMVGNPLCTQIAWRNDYQSFLKAWEYGKTGYPFVDAIMNQLRSEGWIHHLARHMVACFLTRGDLFVSWEHGARIFSKYLLDADWSINNFNWLWLSASGFFYQYFRVYSPISFGKKTDKNGDYIRKYVPQLKKYPSKYIYEPWTAPLAMQKQWGCVIGEDYPKPIVEHKIVSKQNMGWMASAYKKRKAQKAASSTKKTKKKRVS
eukprot:g4178.t1